MEVQRSQSDPIVRSKVVALGGFTLVSVLIAAVVVGIGYQITVGATAGVEKQITSVVAGGIDSLYSGTVAGPMGGHASAITDNSMSAQRAKLPSVFAKWFTGDPLETYSTRTQAAMSDQINSGLRDVDGGAKVNVTSISLAGTAATVTATAEIWLQTADTKDQLQPKAQGTWDYNLHLVETADGWRIDAIDFSPEKGADQP